jgi:hypothetical protein
MIGGYAMKSLSLQDAIDILVGCSILSTGGGGSLKEGIKQISELYRNGNCVNLLPFNELQDESHYVNPYYCGSLGPEEGNKIYKSEVQYEHDDMLLAVNALQEYLGVNFEGVVSIEYGGGNTASAMAVASKTGKCIVDCDAAGRAVPEMQFSTYYITGNEITPFSIATKYGDSIIVSRVLNDERAEAIARSMAIITDNTVAIADHPIKGKYLKSAVIPSALTYAGKVGKAQREAVENHLDPIRNIIEAADGYILFKGLVSQGSDWEIKNGFTTGYVYVQGIEEYESMRFKTWYRNENMISWINDEIFVTCPDMICIVDLKTGYPITNPNCQENQEVAVLGFRAHELWRSDVGLKLLNPMFFGFENIDYVPIEEIMKTFKI